MRTKLVWSQLRLLDSAHHAEARSIKVERQGWTASNVASVVGLNERTVRTRFAKPFDDAARPLLVKDIAGGSRASERQNVGNQPVLARRSNRSDMPLDDRLSRSRLPLPRKSVNSANAPDRN